MSGAVGGLRRLYDIHGEKLRFLIVGVWNTVFSVVLFNALILVAGREHYLVLFWAVWVVAVVQSTATMKYFAFRSRGDFWRQAGRAYLVYLPAQGLSTLLLWLAVAVVHLSPEFAQLITIFMTTIFSYVGHKYFTFRVPLEVGEVLDESLLEGERDQAP
ncbi:MAG TPA: GtrA family protein [Coriobacteriia bacterium]